MEPEGQILIHRTVQWQPKSPLQRRVQLNSDLRAHES